MPVTYRPSSFQWLAVAEPEIDFDSWGIATATVLFRGPRPGKKVAEQKITAFKEMDGNSNMRLLRYKSVNTTPSFPSISAEYVGFLNGLPVAKSVSAISAQSVRVVGKDPTSGKTYAATIAYRAPQTTWDWWENTTPAETPRNATVLSTLDPLKSIDFMQIESQDGDTVIPISAFTAVINAIIPVVTIDDYVVDPIVPNAIWHCTSIVTNKIIGT